MRLESVARRTAEVAAQHGGWRAYYLNRVRDEGKAMPGCGLPKPSGDERRIATKYNCRCDVCGGQLQVGDPVFWDMKRKKVRHAPTGWRKDDKGDGSVQEEQGT